MDRISPRSQTPSFAALVAFESAARHMSFTRAAVELALTQGAVSRQIRTLEAIVGVSLFERVRRRVVLTDAGRLYLHDVREALARLGEATERVGAFGRAAAPLNLATLPTFGTRWLVPRLPRLAEHAPSLVVNLATRLSPFDFDTEPFDAAIHHGAPIWAGAIAHHLMDETTVPVASPHFRDRHRIRRPADLLGVTLLQQSTRPTAWQRWFRAAGVGQAMVPGGPRYDQFAMVAEAAAAGLGAAMVPRFLVEAELASGRLIVLFDAPFVGDTAYYLVVPEAKAGLPAIRTFRDWLIAEAHRPDSVIA